MLRSVDVSVIIPSFRPKEYIFDCLDSLYKQDLSKDRFEVILVFNGCDEHHNSSVIDTWVSVHLDMHVLVLKTERKGVSMARNMGLDRASGEYITFIDDDDWVSDTFLSELLRNAGADCVSISDSYSYINETQEIDANYRLHKAYNTLKDKKLTLRNARAFFGSVVGKLFHKTIIGEQRFETSLDIGEDSLFAFTISDKINKLSLASAVYYRRIRRNSAYFTNQRSITNLITTRIVLIWKYTCVFFEYPKRYSFVFYLLRVKASFSGIVAYVQRNRRSYYLP